MKPTYEIAAADGLKLRGRCWPAGEKCKAAACLVHGQGEHIGRYDHVARALNQAGIALMGSDLRGHGNSEGPRGHVPSFETFLDDLFQTLQKAQADFPGLPLFLYGHSLGGLIALEYVLQRKPSLTGIIISAPLLKLAFEPPAWKLQVLKLFSALHIHPAISSGLDDSNLSRDLNVVRTYRNDPLTHDRVTPPLALGLVEAGQWCMDHAAGMTTPLLMLHGNADQITSPDATREFAGRVPRECTLEILPGLFHEPHNEPEKTSVLQLITNWIKGRTE